MSAGALIHGELWTAAFSFDVPLFAFPLLGLMKAL